MVFKGWHQSKGKKAKRERSKKKLKNPKPESFTGQEKEKHLRGTRNGRERGGFRRKMPKE